MLRLLLVHFCIQRVQLLLHYFGLQPHLTARHGSSGVQLLVHYFGLQPHFSSSVRYGSSSVQAPLVTRRLPPLVTRPHQKEHRSPPQARNHCRHHFRVLNAHSTQNSPKVVEAHSTQNSTKVPPPTLPALLDIEILGLLLRIPRQEIESLPII